MYLVKNITNGKVILGDLDNLVIKKDEEIDLDLSFSRDTINASRDLEKATNPQRRVLSVLHKDVPVAVPVIQSPPRVAAPIQPSISQGEIDNMVHDVVLKTLAKLNISGQQSPDMAQKLDQILAAMANGMQARSDSPATSTQLPDSGVGRETSIDIQSRLLKRLANNVESHVESKEETKESADVKKNADELSNLLGGEL